MKQSPKTLVIQSHHRPLPYPWLEHCLESVRSWCAHNQFEYRFLTDELFDTLPEDLLANTKSQPVIASDLARLYQLQQILNEGYETAIWLDADFLIFAPDNFALPLTPYAVGREVWIQENEQGRLRVYKKVHNAFLMFQQDNSFLAFYIETAERLLRQNTGSKAPQFIGPKLLTALHNISHLPVMESAGMLSPLVIKDILQGTDKALRLFVEHSPAPICAANLCISSRQREELDCHQMEQLINKLLGDNISFR